MDSYTFVRPDTIDTWWILSKEDPTTLVEFEVGHSLQVSESCNPNFVIQKDLDDEKRDCDHYYNVGGCDLKVKKLIKLGNWNTNGFYETMLQCPQCGCGSEGAVNLNDLIFNQPLQ